MAAGLLHQLPHYDNHLPVVANSVSVKTLSSSDDVHMYQLHNICSPHLTGVGPRTTVDYHIWKLLSHAMGVCTRGSELAGVDPLHQYFGVWRYDISDVD